MVVATEHARVDQLVGELVDRVVAKVRERLPRARADMAAGFVPVYAESVPPDDLLADEAETLYGAALGLFQFAEQRRPGTPKIRVFNPTFDEHGWHTSHTVIEIVNDDMPFLVNSVTAALNGLGRTVHLVIHPVVRVSRDGKGRLTAFHGRSRARQGGDDGDVLTESLMHVEVDEQTDPAALAAIQATLEEVLGEVRAAFADWTAMRARMGEVIESLRQHPPPGAEPSEIADSIDFLSWLGDDHFTFLGYREYCFRTDRDAELDLEIMPDRGLGMLTDAEVSVFEGTRDYASLPPDIQAFMRQPRLLMVVKANRKSRVHRPVLMDTLIVKMFDKDGKVVGERMFVGLFTAVAYNRSARDIPYLSRKVARTLARAEVDPDSHDGKALTNILDTYPRDELFQASEDELLQVAMGVLYLQERHRTALFVRIDPYERFASCLVYVPRDRYNTDLRQRFQTILERAFGGRVSAFYTQLSEGVHARVHFIVETVPGQIPEIGAVEIEARLVDAARSWSDKLQDALIESKGEEKGLALLGRYRDAFPTSYREQTVAAAAVQDIDRIEALLTSGEIGLNLHRPIEAEDHQLHFKLYHAGAPVPLSDALPMLEHMGLKVISENPYEIRPAGLDQSIWIHDFETQSPDRSAIDLGRIKERFQDAFARVWSGAMEDDGFNRLVLSAGLEWREVTLLRAFGKYLRQARFAFSQDALEDTLAANPEIARAVVALFAARFDPATTGDRAATVAGIMVELEHRLDEVSNLDEDRILRRFVNLARATLRTNYFQPGADGQPKSAISFKLDSQAIDDLPLPRPWREIFVYSPRVEAVHLRGGKVARGGIRWSDRREDFRTEILGLMKAQMVKNAVIVPVGSKGGFVVKRPPAAGGREALQAEAIECYRTMMRGMLDITDNIVDGALVPPAAVVRHDEDDPYLVVAADKGTATFSDIANGISQEYGFWLDDAFASGGSAGYDHKAMGITARGGWESVKRHFRELGRDIQSEDFTVIGIGDMSGDVFGNGMLLSRHIRLVAAFNHLHIFVDPNPDAATGFAERERLFQQARGSWDQYDTALISEGGGVFDRKAKSISLTPQIQALTGIATPRATPNELITALLKAEVDLLWFGGIGTYIKARSEGHADVGDKANDPLRVDGQQVRARVIGEGANLGVTQRGRIEYAQKGGPGGAGGLLNTDFIDNSAGVDCSDHEVNIKILLGSVVAAGDMTLKQRNALLESMTDMVAGLVLRHNYLQTQALSVTLSEGAALLDQQIRFMKGLEKAGQLDRAIEFLPNDDELTERLARREGLSRPELTVLLAYSKITLYEALLASDLPDDPALVTDLLTYFPEPLREAHRAAIDRHTLKREIIATAATNSLVNRTGATFITETMDKTGVGAEDIARAYIVARDSFRLRELWERIEALDTKVDAQVQIRMMLATRRLIERATVWLLRHSAGRIDIGAMVEMLQPGLDELTANLDRMVHEAARSVLEERTAGMVEAGVPEDLAHHISALNVIAAGCDLIRIAEQCGAGILDAGPVYFGLGYRLGLAWLRDSGARMSTANHWQKQAVAAIVEDLYGLQADLTVKVIEGAGDTPLSDSVGIIDNWIARRRQPVDRIDLLIGELRALDSVDLSMLAVANRRLRGLMAG